MDKKAKSTNVYDELMRYSREMKKKEESKEGGRKKEGGRRRGRRERIYKHH